MLTRTHKRVNMVHRVIHEESGRNAVQFADSDPDQITSIFLPAKEWELRGRPRSLMIIIDPVED